MQITIEIPEAVVSTFGDTPEVVARRLLEDAAIEGYRSGTLSHFQVRQMLGHESWNQTEDFLTEHKVPLHYSVEDLEADRQTLDKLLGRL
jgi:predicted HTH domain antitoxin